MSLLVETIKTEEGKLQNVSFHNRRMIRSLYDLFKKKTVVDLDKIISVPKFAFSGIYKCRIIYDDKTFKTEFSPYLIKKVGTLKTVEDNSISYPYKYLDRENILKLYELRGNCDDIIIIKDGMVTDSSYANLAFRDIKGNWYSPETYLLPGTRRAYLLQKGMIKEAEISVGDIAKYTEVRLINSMIGIDDTEGIPVTKIFFQSDL